VKLRAIHSTGRLLRRLRLADSALREAAADAAAEALRSELQRESENPIHVGALGSRRFVGSPYAADAAREFGTLEQNPSPWLAPVLPLALEPMRAAANNAAARAFSKFGKTGKQRKK
jgi:hypothetical protein